MHPKGIVITIFLQKLIMKIELKNGLKRKSDSHISNPQGLINSQWCPLNPIRTQRRSHWIDFAHTCNRIFNGQYNSFHVPVTRMQSQPQETVHHDKVRQETKAVAIWGINFWWSFYKTSNGGKLDWTKPEILSAIWKYDVNNSIRVRFSFNVENWIVVYVHRHVDSVGCVS